MTSPNDSLNMAPPEEKILWVYELLASEALGHEHELGMAEALHHLLVDNHRAWVVEANRIYSNRHAYIYIYIYNLYT